MTERILQLQEHGDMQLIERWFRAGLMPAGASLVTIAQLMRPNSRLLTLHTSGLDIVHAIFIDRPDDINSQSRTIHGIQTTSLGQEKINVHTFVEYAERCKYIDAKLYLNTNFKYMRGKVHHRFISPKLMPLGVIPDTVELHHKSDWERKIELLKRNPLLNEMRLKLVDFPQEDVKKACRALKFERTATVFVL
ncbi:TPA: hypothetical protein ACTPQ1_004751 [Salmonella enterica]